MKKKPKYAYVTVIQFKHEDSPWKDVSEYLTAKKKKSVRRDLKEYRMPGYGKYRAINGQYRAIKRRVPNEL